MRGLRRFDTFTDLTQTSRVASRHWVCRNRPSSFALRACSVLPIWHVPGHGEVQVVSTHHLRTTQHSWGFQITHHHRCVFTAVVWVLVASVKGPQHLIVVLVIVGVGMLQLLVRVLLHVTISWVFEVVRLSWRSCGVLLILHASRFKQVLPTRVVQLVQPWRISLLYVTVSLHHFVLLLLHHSRVSSQQILLFLGRRVFR